MRLLKIFYLLVVFTTIIPAQGIVINEMMSSNTTAYKDETGSYPDWIELYNTSSTAVNLAGYGLSDDSSLPYKWIFPSGTIGAHQFLLIACDDKNLTIDFNHLHTNFSIKAGGEQIILTDASGNIVDQLDPLALSSDVSIGRKPDGSTNWLYFANGQSTPNGTNNNATGTAGITDPPTFSQTGGFFSGSVTVSLSVSAPQTTIRYTTNGSEPTTNSQIYSSPIILTKTTVIRAKAFQTSFLPSKTITNTYLINERNNLPVISLSTDSSNFFDNKTGIYVTGPKAKAPNPDNPDTDANYWQDWERPIHIEMYEPDGTQGFSIDAGVKINGGYSREYPQKSLAIFARGQYGFSEIKYKIFPDLPIDKFQTINLRNSGQDWASTMFRDGMEESLMKESGLDVRAYRPAVLFLDGVYWGIYNIREKENEHFLASHHPGVDPDNVTRVQLDGEAEQGDPGEYNALYDYIKNNDMSVSLNYEYIKTKMDVDNFISYMVTEIYMNNTDWPGSNIKYWKSNSVDGKWQWILQDLDFGYGLYDYSSNGNSNDGYRHNSLDFATATNGPSWPNPPWSTLLLRQLLKNPEFKNNFINRFADFSNVYFVPEKAVALINRLKSAIEPEMPYHIQRWRTTKISNNPIYPQTMGEWNNEVQRMIDFANNRLPYIRQNYLTKFSLSGTANVNLIINQPASGTIKINSISVSDNNWSGIYFKGIPINLTAVAKPGYKFAGWSGASGSTSADITITPNGDVNLTANFEVDQAQPADAIVINEINYKSAVSPNPEDWVELYNKSTQRINISGYVFKDDKDTHIFTIPDGTFLDSGHYLVLCRDTSLFKAVFPNVTNYIGNLSFGLSSSGSLVRLFDNNSNLLDNLTYGVATPWPSEPNGTGATLALKSPELDNSVAENWSYSPAPGTPGSQNTFSTTVSISGVVSYENNLSSPMPNVTVSLTPSAGGNSITTSTDTNGNYSFNSVAPGNYILTASSTLPVPASSINANDALLAVKSYVGIVNLTPLKLKAGNVDNDPSGLVNANDALLMLKKYVGMINQFNVPSNWIFEEKSILVSQQNLTMQNLKGIAIGDIDASAGESLSGNQNINVSNNNTKRDIKPLAN